MNPTDVVTASGLMHDPLIVGLAWVFGIVSFLFAIGKPIRDYLKSEKRDAGADSVLDARSGAETVLYNHLSEQVKEYRDIADKAFTERLEMMTRLAKLEGNDEDLKETREILGKLKARLDEKDAQIKKLLDDGADERKQFLAILQAKDSEIARRDDRISALEKAHKELELRLAKDEATVGFVACPFHTAVPFVSPEEGLVG